MKDKDKNKGKILSAIVYFANIFVLIVSLICILIVVIYRIKGQSSEIKDLVIEITSIISPVLAIITIFLTLILHREDSKQNNQILSRLQESVEINTVNCDFQTQVYSRTATSKLNLMLDTFELVKIQIKKYLKSKKVTFKNILVESVTPTPLQIIMKIFFEVKNANEIKEVYLNKFSLKRHAKSKDCLLEIASADSLNVRLTPQRQSNLFSIELYTDIDALTFQSLIEKLDKERNPFNKSASRLDLEIVLGFKTQDNLEGYWEKDYRAYLDVNETSTDTFTFRKKQETV